jgi:hypothetical protein
MRASRDSGVESALRQGLLDPKMSCAPRFLSSSVNVIHRASGNFDPQHGLSFPELISRASKAGRMDGQFGAIGNLSITPGNHSLRLKAPPIILKNQC